MVHKRLVLNQIPILWNVKFSREREEMDSHLENIFLFELLISTLLSGGNGLVSLFSFFFIASAPVFFFVEWRKMTHTP